MSKKATPRREEKLVKKLHSLAVSNPVHLKATWGRLLNCWILEAIRRGQKLQQEHDPAQKKAVLRGEKFDPESLDPERHVYGILEKAERLLALCSKLGPEVERLVGAETRDLLNHNCAKAIALAVDPNMYHLSVKLHKPKLKQRNKAISAIPSTSTQGA